CHKGGNKKILMVTDGEPTAHLEGGVADFNYPPTERTFQETLKEVERCTRERITINPFMLEQNSWLMGFVEKMAKINRGRAFFSAADKLGEDVVVDFVRSRPSIIGRLTADDRLTQGSCRRWATRIACAAASRSPRRSKAWAVRTTP